MVMALKLCTIGPWYEETQPEGLKLQSWNPSDSIFLFVLYGLEFTIHLEVHPLLSLGSNGPNR